MPDPVLFYGFGCFGAWVDGGSFSDFTKLDSQSVWTSGKHTKSGNLEPFRWVTGDGVLRIDVDFWDQNQPPPAADMDHFGTWENDAWLFSYFVECALLLVVSRLIIYSSIRARLLHVWVSI